MNANDKRYVEFFNATKYFAFGSLWKIKNILWKKVIAGFVSKNDDGFHPAVSIYGGRKITSLSQTIPMLFGSHSNKSGFQINDFSSTKGKKTKAGFFKIIPYFFCVSNTIGKHSAIEPNGHKPSLTQEEISELKSYLQKKGIKYGE